MDHNGKNDIPIVEITFQELLSYKHIYNSSELSSAVFSIRDVLKEQREGNQITQLSELFSFICEERENVLHLSLPDDCRKTLSTFKCVDCKNNMPCEICKKTCRFDIFTLQTGDFTCQETQHVCSSCYSKKRKRTREKGTKKKPESKLRKLLKKSVKKIK